MSGTARPGRPEVLLVPGLGSVGYLVELLQACVSAFEPPGQLRCTLPDCLRGGRRFREYLRSALADRPEDDIRRIDAPVLVARGRHDHFASQRGVEELADAAPRGRARTLPGAHAVPYNHPRAVALLAGEAAAGLGG